MLILINFWNVYMLLFKLYEVGWYSVIILKFDGSVGLVFRLSILERNVYKLNKFLWWVSNVKVYL